jgi:hypothetical protein
MISTLMSFFVGIAELILGLRIFFRLVDANSAAAFVHWIYETSDTLMVPFRGIFPPATLKGGIVLDVSAIFAAVMYLLFGVILLSILTVLPVPTSLGRLAKFNPLKRPKK